MAAQFKIGARLVGQQEVLESLRNLKDGTARMRTLMKRIGEQIIVPSLRETLGSGGRGAWPAEKRPVKKHRMLGADGRIAKGLKVVAGDRSVQVGSTSGFAVWAQQGFTAHIPAERPKRKPIMRLFADGKVVFATKVQAHTIVVPKREFLILTDGDREAIVAASATYLDRLARREAKAGQG